RSRIRPRSDAAVVIRPSGPCPSVGTARSAAHRDSTKEPGQMQVSFGWSADGAGWSDAGSSRATGTAGAVRMGPRALVTLLQTRLGLTRPAVEQAVRITQYLQLLEQHIDGLAVPESFWPARSFRVDPWSTARQLLQWRD